MEDPAGSFSVLREAMARSLHNNQSGIQCSRVAMMHWEGTALLLAPGSVLHAWQCRTLQGGGPRGLHQPHTLERTATQHSSNPIITSLTPTREAGHPSHRATLPLIASLTVSAVGWSLKATIRT